MKRFRWETGFDSQLVLAKLVECRKISAEGRVSFSGYEYHFWLPVLESAVRVSEEVGQQLKHHCISQAANDASLTLKDCDAFLQRCEAAYDQLTKRPKQKFLVVSSMTYSGEPLFSRIMDGDVRIQWEPSQKSKLMAKIREARNGLAKQRQNYNVVDEPANLTRLLVHVSAYDVYDAHTLASDSVDCLRGMLNLFVNTRRGISPFGMFRRPHAINRFRVGPYRTVHGLDGSLATETFWYEHRWLHETPSVKFNPGAGKFKARLKTWWGRLQRNPLRNHIRQGLLRYCRALDVHDAEPSLMEMWSALESLTGTQREKGDLTVDRIAKLFIDRDEARQVANHIRIRRNSTVHAARALGQHEADAILEHAETLAARVLFFCLEEGRRFAARQELYNFLDLKLDAEKLKRTIALSKFFVQYQSRKPRA
jgi:hypothetical protein